MAAVTATMIKELRELTNAGMSDCKNALVEADGNMDRAIEILREKGLSAASKKAGRIASEGLVNSLITNDNNTGVIVEVNSETDFVAKNDIFKTFVGLVCNQIVKSSSDNIEKFMEEKWLEDSSITVKDALNQKIAIIGENLNIRRFEKITKVNSGQLVSYIHGGGRIAVLLYLQSDKISDVITEAGKNICMQISAMNPKFLSREDVSNEYIEHEKEILTTQAKTDPANSSKPTDVIEKMITGRLNKELKQVCLLEQEYVKESDMTVSQYLVQVSEKVGSTIKIAKFVRFETGEGIKKKKVPTATLR